MNVVSPAVLQGRVALVTGSAQGIGFAIAQRLHASGAWVALVDVNGEALQMAKAELGEGVETYETDLTDLERAASVVREVQSAQGPVEILVNNAGRRGVYPVAEYPLDDWNATLALNLTAPFVLAREVLPVMVRNGGGRIINVTSVAADLAFTRRSAYNSSKAGLTMLTKSIAVEYAKAGVRCNAVAPGIIETPINAEYLRNGDEGVKIIEGTPTGSWGQPGDIASAVHFLALDESAFINGEVIRVDGGWTAGKGY